MYEKIEFHPSFVIMMIFSILTATVKQLIFFTIILLIHEIGHAFIAKLFGWNINSITIYPYGGCTKFNDDINKSFLSEFLVLISGPIFQIIVFLIFKKFINYNDYILIKKFNLIILIFNILPIYPLDGGKLINLFLSLIFPYRKSLYISIFLSIPVLIFLFLNFKYYLVNLSLLVTLINEYKNVKYIYNKFLLERYLKPIRNKNVKIIYNINNLYKNKGHLIKYENKYYEEIEYLNLFFCKKTM